jgi:hypothetical protein
LAICLLADAKISYCFVFSHCLLAKQGDVGMVPPFMEKKPPLKIGEVAETKIRPGFR